MRHEPKLNLWLARAAVLGLVVLSGACTIAGGSTSTRSADASAPAPQTRPPTADASGLTTRPGPSTPTSGASADATPPSTGITEAQALASVQAFAPHATGLRVTESETMPWGRVYQVQSEDIIAQVDAATGQVRTFLDNAAMPTSTTVKLTKDEALVTATAWLAGHGVTTTGLSPTTTLMDHGSTQDYAVDFEGRVNGARVPHRVNVTINPESGAVYAFVLYTRPFVPPPSPKLTVAEATTAARAEEQDPNARVTATDLAIAYDAAGNQILVYEFDLTRTDGFYAKVQVDALSGAVTVLGRG